MAQGDHGREEAPAFEFLAEGCSFVADVSRRSRRRFRSLTCRCHRRVPALVSNTLESKRQEKKEKLAQEQVMRCAEKDLRTKERCAIH